ncbi:hypothetical protein BDC45DRAFT_545640 [Circinella umbellata]|nr:hypothetical protein BDC45DRAFT_545640 [Circinella umbellata]
MALFEPIQVGTNQLQHRIVLAPLTRLRTDENNAATDLTVEYYSQRATPGGLLISESNLTSLKNESRRKVIGAVHAKGSVIFAQLIHLGRVGPYQSSVGPSAIAPRGLNASANNKPYEIPRELTKSEIKDIIQEFFAGFDGVELHGANGFLIDQLIKSNSNMRTDEYGGSIENRASFVFEVTDAASDTVGAEHTSNRFLPWDDSFLLTRFDIIYNKDVEDDTPYNTWGYIVKHLDPNLAYVYFVEPRDDYVRAEPDFDNLLDPFRVLWKGPFISAGGYSTNSKLIVKTAKENPKNLIAVGRTFIANPDLVERLKHQWPLNKYNRNTFYGGSEVGYTDYPFYDNGDQAALNPPSL